MLHAVGKLREHGVRHVRRALRHEEHADTARADQLHGLLDLLHEHRRGVAEEHVRLIEEEHELRLFKIADLRHGLEQLREQPEKEARVQRRVLHELDAVEHVDHAASLGVGADPVVHVERRLAEEQLAALFLQRQQRAEDRRNGLRGDVAVLHAVIFFMVVHIVQQRAQVLEIVEQQSAVVCNAENDLQNARLRLAQAENAGEQLGPHFAHGGAHGMAAGLVNVPERGRVAAVGKFAGEGKALDALLHILAVRAGGADTGDVALHVAQENGHARIGEGFRQHLHRNGLAGAGRTGDQAVPVAHGEGKLHPLLAGETEIDFAVIVHDRVNLRIYTVACFAFCAFHYNRRSAAVQQKKLPSRRMRAFLSIKNRDQSVT